MHEFDQLKTGDAYFIYCTKALTWDLSFTNPTTQFTYDGDGGRVKKSVFQPANTKSQITLGDTVYVGSLYEVESSGKTTKHVFAGANKVCAIEKTASTSETYYFHSDHLGSSNLITDEAGKQAGLTQFSPYGATFKQTGTYDPKYKFTGKELDPSTGLYYYGARYYDAQLGRFTQADTIVQAPYDPQSLNRYTYCRNNPINLVDPTGHWWFIPIIIAAVIGGTLGGVSAGMSGQSIGMGILMGAMGGALTAAGGAAFGFWGAVAAGAFSGAANSAAFGGNIGIGALTGGLGAGLGFGFGSLAGSDRLLGLGASMLAGSITGGIGSELNGGSFGSGAWMGAAFSAAGYAGSVAGNYIAKGIESSNTRKIDAQKQLTVNERENTFAKKADPNLKAGMVRRFVGQREYIKILNNREVVSYNEEGTHWTPNNIISPEEATQLLGIQMPYAAVDVPVENFDAAKVMFVRTVPATGLATEVLYKTGGSVSVRGGRVIDFQTMTEKTFIYDEQ